MADGPGQWTRSHVGRRDQGGGERRMVEPARPLSYGGQPIIKEPVWTWEIPTYFFIGGIAGGSAVLGLVADVAGRQQLARRAWPVALGAVSVSPILLISDLGRPERFYNMLRVAKPTSPMSTGTWILTSLSGSCVIATTHSLFGWCPRLGPVAKLTAGLLGPMLSTYTAVLISDTAVPVWHQARRDLPFVFAASSAAGAGAIAAVLAPSSEAGPARRLAVLGSVLELAATQVMERRLGLPADVYHQGDGGKFSKLAKGLGAAGGLIMGTLGRRSRPARVAGGALILAGAMSTRWSIYKAGFQSARDPAHTVASQRGRLED